MRVAAPLLRSAAIAAALLTAALPAAATTPYWDLKNAKKIGDATYRLSDFEFNSFEISGIVLSRTRANLFWGIQDAGSDLVFGFNSAGQLLQTVAVDGHFSEDLEDIAADNEGYLYLADTGTNLRARDEVSVHRIREPGPDDTTVTVERSWRLTWPETGRDCESMVVHDGYVWLVAKIRDAGQKSTLARFSLADTNAVIRLEVLGDLDALSPAAGADLTPDGDQFAVSSRAGNYYWKVNGNVASAVGRVPVFSPSTPDTKKEGLAFVPQGLLVATETRDRYLDITPSVIPKAPEASLEATRGPEGGQLFWSAPYGVDCTLEYRERLDQGEWSAVATNFPGLGFRTEWKRRLPVDNGGYFRLMIFP
ncbi:MAG TPA: hypothetical protein PLX89_15445 [Verrucomicrobiota bacterium]|nr:hypothetical protein [Verrucomicrobiales bacterium]HRI14388.1 hypothetical protein [Verrucomicrobiota bacterium]